MFSFTKSPVLACLVVWLMAGQSASCADLPPLRQPDSNRDKSFQPNPLRAAPAGGAFAPEHQPQLPVAETTNQGADAGNAALPAQPLGSNLPRANAAELVPDATSAAIPASKLAKEKIDKRLEEVQASAEFDEPTRAELLKKYKAAQDWLKSVGEAEAKTATYQADVQQAPKLLAEAKTALAEPTRVAVISVPADATLVQVEQFAAEAEANFKATQESLEKIEEKLQRRGERKNEVLKLADETKQRLEETRKLLGNPPVPDEAPLLADARRTELDSRLMALESQLSLYKAEIARHDALTEVLPLTRDLTKREKNLLEARLTKWQAIVTSRRKRESELQAIAARRKVQDAHPALRTLAERNSALAEQRKTLADSIARVAQQAKAVKKEVEKLEQEFQKSEQRVRRAGHSATVGLMLRRQSENLPNQRECNQRLHEIQADMPQANLAVIEVEEQREALGDIEATVPQVLASVAVNSSERNANKLEPLVRELLESKSALLASLATDYETYLNDLSELEISNRRLTEQIQKSADYIGEHVFWIRSADPLWIDDVARVARGVSALAVPQLWLEAANHCGLDLIKNRLSALAVCLAVILLSIFHVRLRAKMVAVCTTKTGGVTLRFGPTIQAIGLAAIIASEWPLLLAYLGWRMASADVTSGLTAALGVSLQYAAALLWVTEFVKQVLRGNGLAESHFGWSTFSAKLLRKELRWLAVLGIPLAIIVVGMQRFQDGEWSASIGRLAFVAGMLLLARFMHSILNAKENVLRESIAQDSGKWFARLRALSHAVGVGVPCLLAILAVAGYYYSAQQVALRWQATLGVSLALLLAYSVASRWCLVKRRNLAMEQARERQRLAAEGAATKEPGALAPAIRVEAQQPDLSAIHEQLRYLLRHAVTVGMVVCSWFIWADVLPALKVFDHVVLWETWSEVTELHEAADGTMERTTQDKNMPTTLRHAMFACLLIAATLIIGRNLPALLEVTVLQSMPFDKGGRHAISVLLKYAVAVTGVFLACRTMSFTWSSVQWLAAGMTVGLGFGLQEIFANFVSGLILLFERPIRVGDVITLGEVTGVVSDIRIRATTVTNWDRKELIVPNKDLITGRLLNWTLSDTTNRIVIKVGVAYRSDPQAARELILGVIRQHPNVLVDPAPNVTFEEFADSALNLVARAYVSSMDVRMETIHGLHVSVHKALSEAGIEIAFPQRDINVRGLESIAIPETLAAMRKVA